MKLLKTAIDKLPKITTEVWKSTSYNQATADFLNSDRQILFTTLTLCFISKDSMKRMMDNQPETRTISVGYNLVDAINIAVYTANSENICLIWPIGNVSKTKAHVMKNRILTIHYTVHKRRYTSDFGL